MDVTRDSDPDRWFRLLVCGGKSIKKGELRLVFFCIAHSYFLLIIFHYVNQTVPRNRSQSQSRDGLFYGLCRILYIGYVEPIRLDCTPIRRFVFA